MQNTVKSRGFVALLAFGLLASQSASGQGRTPEGSYRASCWDIRVSGGTLIGTCRDGGKNNTAPGRFAAAGEYKLARFAECRGDIWYFRQALHCQRAVADNRPPSGSYRAICRDIRVEGTRLFATCRLPDMSERRLSMANFRACTGDIAMISGRFRCNR
jgi:hypothetical protein